MNKNITIIFLTGIASILIIGLPTVLKIHNAHEERLYEVATKKIIESAELCYREQICIKEEMTLKELQATGYLEENIINPKTKTYFDENLKLIEENFQVKMEEI